MTERATATERAHDLVLYGATSFVGRLVAADLAEHAPPGLRVALGGRSRQRLEQVRAGLPAPGRAWPLVVADSADAGALADLAARTRVVATTVGPYARYGFDVARACAEAGTHYADLTGEVDFVRDLIDRLDARAQQTGARLVTACGFDAVPSDLGVLLLHERAQADGAGGLGDTTLLVTRLRGGLSGGTVASMRDQVVGVRSRPDLRRLVLDPYALSPHREDEPRGGPQPDVGGVFRDAATGQWTAPWLMANFNSRIVRRSAALTGHAYGDAFRYRERMAFGTDLTALARALATTGGLGLAALAMVAPLAGRAVDAVLPAPGEGPDERTRREGRFRVEIRTTTAGGRRYLATVAAQGDPGYAATAVMFAESARCLAEDSARLPARAGVLTPATAMGDALVDRLRVRGFTLAVEEQLPVEEQGAKRSAGRTPSRS